MIQPVLKALAKTEAETKGRSQILHRLGLGVQQRSSKFDKRARERERESLLDFSVGYFAYVLLSLPGGDRSRYFPLLDTSKPQLRPWHCGPRCYKSAGHTNQESYGIVFGVASNPSNQDLWIRAGLAPIGKTVRISWLRLQQTYKLFLT